MKFNFDVLKQGRVVDFIPPLWVLLWKRHASEFIFPRNVLGEVFIVFLCYRVSHGILD